MSSPTLQMFRDIAGVEGVFLVNDRGQLLLRDLPAFIPAALIEQVGARLSTFFAATGEAMTGTEEAYLQCALQNLYLRRFSQGILGVLCREGAQVSSIRFAANIFVRQPPALQGPGLAPTGSNRMIPPVQNPPPRKSTRTGIWG